jgi:hypothetical protein
VLDAQALERDFAPLRYMLGSPDAPRTYRSHMSVHEHCASIRGLMRARPSFFERFDYGWAADPRAYAIPHDAWLQHQLLSVLAVIPDDKPGLTTHRPTVARLLPVTDFASSSVRGERFDYVLIAQRHLDLVREFGQLIRSLHTLAETHGVEVGQSPRWMGETVAALLRDEPQELFSLLEPMQAHVVALDRGESPRVDAPPLAEWMASGVAKDSGVAIEVVLMYTGVDQFLLLHELGHLLNGDLHTVPRNLHDELHADAAAVSLGLVRSEHPDQPEDAVAYGRTVAHDVAFGGVTYLALLRLWHLFAGAHRVMAHMADSAIAEGEGPLIAYAEGQSELEARMVHLPLVARVYGVTPVWQAMLLRIQELEPLFAASCAKLLKDAGVSYDVESLPRLRFDEAANRAVQALSAEDGSG